MNKQHLASSFAVTVALSVFAGLAHGQTPPGRVATLEATDATHVFHVRDGQLWRGVVQRDRVVAPTFSALPKLPYEVRSIATAVGRIFVLGAIDRREFIRSYAPDLTGEGVIAELPPGANATTFAIDSDGLMAVAHAADGTIRLSTASRPLGIVPAAIDVRRMVFVSDRLVVLSGTDVRVLELDVRATDRYPPLSSLRPIATGIRDVATAAGYVYTLTSSVPRRLVVNAVGQGDAVYATIEDSERRTEDCDAIAAARASIVCLNSTGRSSVLRALSVATFDVYGKTDAVNAALADLFLTLARGDLLPRQRETLTSDVKSVRELFIQKGIVVPPGATSRTLGGDEQWAEVWCWLNKCTVGPDRADVLAAPLAARRTVVLPALRWYTEDSYGLQNLDGNRLDSFFQHTRSAGRWTAASILDSNPELLTSLEATMNRLGYLVATPLNPAISPGAVITIRNGREEVVARPAGCNLAAITGGVWRGTTRTTFTTAHRGGAVVLPSDLLRQSVEINLRIGPIVERRLSSEQLATARRCYSAVPSDALMVTSTLSASNIRITLEDQLGETLRPRPSQLSAVVPPIQPDTTGPATGILRAETVVAYRAQRLDDALDPELPSDPGIHKRDTPQDIGGLTKGTAVVPLLRYRVDIPFPQVDALKTTIDGVLRRHANATWLPQTNLGARGVSMMTDPTGLLDRVKSNRAGLFQAMAFTADLRSGESTKIGVAEDKASVQYNHPDFVNDAKTGRTVWLDPEAADANARILVEPGNCQVSAHLAVVDNSLDHGTHIAALLAGQGCAGVEGLFPAASLYLVDTAKEKIGGFATAIITAVGKGVRTFNISQVFGSPEAFRDLYKTSDKTWDRNLYVAAAGNEVGDLKGVAQPPVSLGPDLPKNMIGVAAGDDQGHVLLECDPHLPEMPPSKKPLKPCSNFGMPYVHLVAPAYRVFSAASGSRYVAGTGTSIATPLVTAVAAMLRAEDEKRSPYWVKLRLIATADFRAEYFEKNYVWGGKLNAARALFLPDDRILRVYGRDDVYKIEMQPGAELELEERGRGVTPSGESMTTQLKILWKDILRIWRDPEEETFWLVYLEPEGSGDDKVLRIARGARLKDTGLKTKNVYQWKGGTMHPVQQPFTAEQITDYVAPPNDQARFPK